MIHFTTEKMPCLVLTSDDLFARPDFIEFLKGKNVNTGVYINNPATWYRGVDGEYKDTFVTYVQGEGSDADSMPADVWEAICQACEDARVDHCVVRLVDGRE